MPNGHKPKSLAASRAAARARRFALSRDTNGTVSIRTVSKSADQVYFLKPSRAIGQPLQDHLDGQPEARQAIVSYAAQLAISTDPSKPSTRDFYGYLRFFPQESFQLLDQVQQQTSEAVAKLTSRPKTLATQAALAKLQTMQAETRTSNLRDRLAYHIAAHGMHEELTTDHLVDFLVDQLVVRERELTACKTALNALEDGGSLTAATVAALLALDLSEEEATSEKVVSGNLKYRLVGGDTIVTGYELQQFESGVLPDKALKRHLLASGLKHWRAADSSDEDRLISDHSIADLKTELRLDGISDPADAVARVLFDATSDLKTRAQGLADSSSGLMLELLQQPGKPDSLDKLKQYVSQHHQASALRLVSLALLDAIRDGTGDVIDALEVSNDEVRAVLAELAPSTPDDLRVSLSWLKTARAERRLQRQAVNTVLHTLQDSLRDDALVELTIPASSYEDLKGRALRLLRKKFGHDAEDARSDLEGSLVQKLGHLPSALPNDLSELKAMLSGEGGGEDVDDDSTVGEHDASADEPVSAGELLSWLDDSNDMEDGERRTVLEGLAAYLLTIREEAPPIDPKDDTGELSSIWAELESRLKRDQPRPRRRSEGYATGGPVSGDKRRGSVSSLQLHSDIQRPSSAGA